jgi:hypothetical protein
MAGGIENLKKYHFLGVFAFLKMDQAQLLESWLILTFSYLPKFKNSIFKLS